MSVTVETNIKENPTGIEDVVHSLRVSARTARILGEDLASIVERELAMAISISEKLRDEIVSENALAEARKAHLPARLREDAHRLVDLSADASSLLYVIVIKFFENLTDERRPLLSNNEPAKESAQN